MESLSCSRHESGCPAAHYNCGRYIHLYASHKCIYLPLGVGYIGDWPFLSSLPSSLSPGGSLSTHLSCVLRGSEIRMLCKIDKPLPFPFLTGCKGMGIYRYSPERVRAHTCACACRAMWIFMAIRCIPEVLSGPVCMCENVWASRSVCGSSAPVCVGVAIVCACVARVCLVGHMWEEANNYGLRFLSFVLHSSNCRTVCTLPPPSSAFTHLLYPHPRTHK